MKRSNQPHRRLGRSRRVLERLQEREQNLKGMKGRDNKIKRQKMREEIKRVKHNMKGLDRGS